LRRTLRTDSIDTVDSLVNHVLEKLVYGVVRVTLVAEHC
jgi:phage tail protein X